MTKQVLVFQFVLFAWAIFSVAGEGNAQQWDPLPENANGLRLDHMNSDQYQRPLVAASTGLLSDDPNAGMRFVIDDDENLYFMVNSVDNDRQRDAIPQGLYAKSIHRTRFPETRDESGWSAAETELLAVLPMDATVRFIEHFGGKVFFSVSRSDYVRDSYPNALWDAELNSEKAIKEEGIFVIEGDTVRRLSLPNPFSEAKQWERYPPDDQLAITYYLSISNDQSQPSWKNRDGRVFVYTGPSSLFFSRNRVTDDERRLLDIVEMKLDTEEFGEIVTVETSVNQRYWRKAGVPILVDQTQLVFLEYQTSNSTKALHFQLDKKTKQSKVRQDGWSHFDESGEHYFFCKQVALESAAPFQISKIRVADNEIVQEFEFENQHFARSLLERKKRLGSFGLPVHEGKRHAHWDFVVDHGDFFWISRDSRTGVKNIIVKVSIDDPDQRTEIPIDWRFPTSHIKTHCSRRFVYFYQDDWIVRVAHADEDESRFKR